MVAPGFSCRLQIDHFTGREAVHPAELLRSCVSRKSSPGILSWFFSEIGLTIFSQ